MLNSPLAAAMRARVYHQRTRKPLPNRGRQLVAALGALLVHVVFLLGFSLGSDNSAKPPPNDQLMQIRLIEAPPPPPAVHGTPPKQHGPRHQGHVAQSAPSREHSDNVQSVAVTSPTPPAKSVVVVQKKADKPRAPIAKPSAAVVPVSPPKPAPAPKLLPIPQTTAAPLVSLPTPQLQVPIPPPFQPEPIRPPQLDGNQPMLSTTSLALPDLPVPAAPPVSMPSIAVDTALPRDAAPASIAPIRAQVSAAPAAVELQPIPSLTLATPSVSLSTQVSVPVSAAAKLPMPVLRPVNEPAATALAPIPSAPSTAEKVQLPVVSVKVDIASTPQKIALQTPVKIASPAPSPAVASTPATSAADKPLPSAAPEAVGQLPSPTTAPKSAATSHEHDVSTAPDATAQGSDAATLGEPAGVTRAAAATSESPSLTPTVGQGEDKGRNGKQPAVGLPGGNQAGADHGVKHGKLGGYVQLQPHGDTRIMSHAVPNIGYTPTRFDKDWTPEGESSIDTALRHAVEKTTVSHTFHLPQGIRIKCAVMPLMPINLFGCANPDPPAKPVDPKVYDRLHLPPANPLVPIVSAASSKLPAAPIKLDNSVQCADARIAGGPPPPGCVSSASPSTETMHAPAASSSSWVPASDQFH